LTTHRDLCSSLPRLTKRRLGHNCSRQMWNNLANFYDFEHAENTFCVTYHG